MRMKLLLVAAATAAMALPAAAQTGSYSRNCQASKNSSQVGGAIVGSILGGVLGSNVAASGHRHDGTAVGAVLGGLVGAGVGGQSVTCAPVMTKGQLPPPPGTYAPGYYPDQQYGYAGGPDYGYDQPLAGGYPEDPGYSDYGYENDRYYDRDIRPHGGKDRLYRDGSRSYKRDDDYAGRDCSTVTQTTRLPDGTVIRRPVEACRDAYYGDWQVEN